MKKKGFTLMELLAVIVILAVLALITIPIVSNLIKNSKKEAFRISVGQVSDNIFFHYTKDWLIEGMDEDKVFDFETHQNLDLLTVSGSLPTSGRMSINPQGKISINVSNGVYCAVKTVEQDKIQVGDIVDGVCQLTGEEVSTCSVRVGYTWNFDYISTGEDRSQEFTAPCDGNYKLEVWGASGGSFNISSYKFTGGAGGYSTGEIDLVSNDKLYINVGGQGDSCTTSSSSTACTSPSTYNGGASCSTLVGHGTNIGSFGCGAGGGATHIALDTGLLTTFENKQDKLLIVAGGGGGANSANYPYNYGDGGSGGGFKGSNNKNGGNDAKLFPGGTQVSGAHFGLGSSGGGGGYYGGSGGISGSGGGSGYNGNSKLHNRFMYCNDCETSNDDGTYTISGKTTNKLAISSSTKEGNGYARITYLGKKSSPSVITCINGMGWEYNYKEENGSGVEQTFTPTCTGYYKLEVWGAQGGSASSKVGGYGGYSQGSIKLVKDVPLYINVGGQGKNNYGYNILIPGGYNGGGSGFTSSWNSRYSASGGGATHIALDSGLLSTFENKQDKLLIVAGGGGGTWYIGGDYETVAAGNGGGYHGGGSTCTFQNTRYSNSGPTQSSGYAFGQGENFTSGERPGGGGGYYGGTVLNYCAAGGSGYIGNTSLVKKSMYCYNCDPSVELSTKTSPNYLVNSNPASFNSKIGNGYAKITYIGESLSTTSLDTIGETWDYAYKEENGIGVEQIFTAPVTGKYKLEVWGAQGGTAYTSLIGGYGGYSVGNITLDKNSTVFINVGGKGTNAYGTNISVAGGYNGGGNGFTNRNNSRYAASGGGATHIAFESGLLTSFDLNVENSKHDKLVIVAGGGGGTWRTNSNQWASINSGSGGGFTGGSGSSYVNWNQVSVSGPTQESGYLFGQGASSTSEGPGAGGGYYGGMISGFASSGGSGFIGNDLLSNKHMYCYNCATSTVEATYTISNGTNSCKNANPVADCAKEGNGYARITLLEIK